jgi:hypothetical protein
MKFKAARSHYEEAALPDLTEAYKAIRIATGMRFDEAQAARAELAWWVARRTPGKDSAENVGQKIAELYSVLYGKDHPSFGKAGLLRAQAAKLRDAGGEGADWVKVEELLLAFYRELAPIQ